MHLPQIWRWPFWHWIAIVAVLLLGIFALMPKLDASAGSHRSTAKPAAAAEFSLLKAINPWTAPQ